MHNNIMAAGSKERPPMLGPGRYSQWHSRFLRYLDTKSNGEYLRKCIFDGPYMPTNVLIAAVEAAENILPVAAHEEVETIHNMTAENKLYFQAEKEAIFLILTGIGDEIYSTVDACATHLRDVDRIVRLHKGFVDDSTSCKDQLYCEFGSFILEMRITWSLYYSRFLLNMMNELTREQLQVSPMKVECSISSTIKPDCVKICDGCIAETGNRQVSYLMLFVVLKQFNSSNDIHSERLCQKCKSISTSFGCSTYILILLSGTKKPQR
ncbi:hypothetical protein Tco_1226596 [Tanacetum coccineum]